MHSSQLYKVSQRSMFWISAFLCIPLFLLLLGGCAAPEDLTIAPGKDGVCELGGGLRDNKAYDAPSVFDDPGVSLPKGARRSPYRSLFANDKPERGCLVLWANQGKNKGYYVSDIKHVQLLASGELKNVRKGTDENEDTFLWKVPKEELSKENLEFRLFVLRGGSSLTDQEHISRCTKVLKPGFQCFPNDLKADNPCWFYLRMEPSAVNKEKFKLSSITNGCQVCAREICGNNKDEDCDGVADNGCSENECHHPGATRKCKGDANANTGICNAGTQTCTQVDEKGKVVFRWGECKGAVKPTQEVCNGLDDDCDGSIDEGASNCCIVGETKACGTDQKAGTGICKAGVQRCYFDAASKGGTFSNCLDAVTPKDKEECNGKDDDCDGSIDNGIPAEPCTVANAQGPCTKGSSQCKDGRKVCLTTHPVGPEICDGIDNDCNGQTDEVLENSGTSCPLPGKPGCNRGVITGCKDGKPICSAIRRPQAKELCGDGIDNDCNGQVDADDAACKCKEGDTQACYSGDPTTKGKGNCKEGTRTCLPSGSWGACVGQVVPSTEVCDGKDNDCDGDVDEDFPTKGQSCILELNKGPCRFGTLTKCDQGKPFCQAGFTASSKETCDNNIDDNCNGLIDDGCGCTPGAKRTCYLGPKGSDSNKPCTSGTQSCIGGKFWSGCQPQILPIKETCNGVDDDCDGQTDENNPGGGAACKVSGKQGLCANGVMQCGSGQLSCVSNYKPTTDDVCDGKDNDCDGSVDEDDALIGKTCTVPKTSGPCAEGKVVCKSGAYVCESTQKAGQETCNGIDDDCDGQVDNNIKKLCPNQKGVCTGASAICAGEKGWLACSNSDNRRQGGADFEVKETLCDGKDNDCDGDVDEGDDGKPLVRKCYEGAANTRSVGECKDGQQACSSGKWGTCIGQVKASAEICGNKKDDNCDGQVDEGKKCGCWGDGRDGVLTVDKRYVLDKEIPKGRKQPFLLQVAVKSIAKSTLTVESSDGLAIGDMLLVVALQGKASTLGQYEMVRILQINDKKVTVDKEFANTYGEKDNSDLQSTNVKAIRVPQFKEVIVKPGGSLVVSAWDGNEGGVLLLWVQEGIRVAPGGEISVAGKGYRGAPARKGQSGTIRPGESYSEWPASGAPADGGGTSGAAGKLAQSGSGGGLLTAGGDGFSSDGKTATDGGKKISLNEATRRLLFGSGGGAGGHDNTDVGKSDSNLTGAGGSGGGILWITARILNNSGLISASGMTGGDAVSDGGRVGGGGGGAGGTLMIRAERLAFYDKAKLTANGGTGGKSAQQLPGQPPGVAGKSKGGDGGEGRVEVEFAWIQGVKRDDSKDELNKWALPDPPVSNELPAICK